MSLIKITDHVKQAKSRLFQMDKEGKLNNDIITSLVEQIQILENQTFKLYEERGLLTSVGAQLDGVGSIVGEQRNGRNDQDYRSAIIAQIEINVSGGEPESIINALRKLLNPFNIEYSDVYPAYYQVFIQSANYIDNLDDTIKSLSPAGIGKAMLTIGSLEKPFGFTELTTEQVAYAIDIYDELLDLGDGQTLLVATNVNTQDELIEGFSELYVNIQFYQVTDDEEDLYDIGDGEFLELKISEADEEYTISDFGGELSELVT